MKLVKTTFFSAIITFIRISSGFAVTKAIAVFTGPSGVALVGSFVNFITIFQTFASGAINTGVIKYTAEYDGNNQLLSKLFSTSLTITVSSSLLIGANLLLFAPSLSSYIFSSHSYDNVIRIFGATIVFYSLNSLLIAILNGKKEIKFYTIVNTVSSLVGLILTCSLVYLFNVTGAFYSLVLAQSVVFFISLGLVYKRPWFSWKIFNHNFDSDIGKKLGKYSFMAVITLFTVPFSQLILRNMLTKELGLEAAGLWQGMLRVSEGYLMIITTSLATYYLPKLSSIKGDQELRQEIFQGYKIVLPVVLLGCICIFYCRFFIIQLLYTQNFGAMERLFLWQLTGDFFKMASWMLAYLMLARAMTRVYVITEIVFATIYVSLAFVLVKQFGLRGITIAHCLNYGIYLCVMIIIFRKLIFKR